MLNIKSQSLVDVALPLCHRLAWKTKHQVDADVADACLAQYRYGMARLLGRMAAVKKPQSAVRECLNAHAHPVDGQQGKLSGVCLGHVIRITFYGYFTLWPTIHIFYITKKQLQQLGRKLTRRATSQINSAQGALEIAASEPHLSTNGINITPHELRTRGGIKAAINATACTERYVNI